MVLNAKTGQKWVKMGKNRQKSCFFAVFCVWMGFWGVLRHIWNFKSVWKSFLQVFENSEICIMPVLGGFELKNRAKFDDFC